MLTRDILEPYTEILMKHDLFEGIPAEALPNLLNAVGEEI